jgi:energy-converting hydrogenase A subunit M
MWRYEGSNTLSYYLRRRDTLRALARDLGVPEDIVVPVAMRQLLLGLSALHAAGLVHRCAVVRKCHSSSSVAQQDQHQLKHPGLPAGALSCI